MKFRLIPPGEFMMGSTQEQIDEAMKAISGNPSEEHWRECFKSEGPLHKVILNTPFYLGIHEVTQGEYEEVIGTNPSNFAPMGRSQDAVIGIDTGRFPVENVTWNDAIGFCAKLCQREELNPTTFKLVAGETVKNDGDAYRLPTEAEWDFACRAGTSTKYWNGEMDADVLRVGWFGANDGGRTHATGELKPNPFGLFDVHGNVWEYVEDWWDPTYYSQFQNKPCIDPNGPTSSLANRRVVRSGSYGYSSSYCRMSARGAYVPDVDRNHHIGFRASITVNAVKELLKRQENARARNAGWPADAPKPAIAPFDVDQAKKHQEEWAAYLKVPVEWENSIGMKFRLIPPGEFLMGSTPEEIATAVKTIKERQLAGYWSSAVMSSGPRHGVIITKPYYLSIHETTQRQYETVIGSNPATFSANGNAKTTVIDLDTSSFPVESVSWMEAMQYCARLSEREALTPNEPSNIVTAYRLPTEAEWELACRAGTTTTFWNGNSERELSLVGWNFANSGGARPHAVGELNANPFGIFDMHGNTAEFVQDLWARDDYVQFVSTPVVDPAPNFETSGQRVSRGGAFANLPFCCTSSFRFGAAADQKTHATGFRVAVAIDAVKMVIQKSSPNGATPGAAP